jgi:alpha-1,6-mannosyltransferase
MPDSSVASAPRARPLRVLDVTDFYSDSVSGGVKTYLNAKASALADAGVEHAAVVPGEADGLEALGPSRLHRIRGRTVPISRGYRVMLSAGALRRIIERERPDLVEVGSPFVIPHLVERATRTAPLPTVGFYHADVVRTFAEPYVPSRWAAPLRVAARTAARALVQRVYRRFDVTVAASESVAAELRALGVPRVRRIGLGVDLQTFHPLAPEQRIPAVTWDAEPGVPVGVYAGRFCAEKRLDVLLAGHARVPIERRPHLLLIGGGPLLAETRRTAEREPRLTVLPYVSERADLARILASADFYLAPGPGETFGLAIAEALACGLPVVVVDRGAGIDRLSGSDAGEAYRHGDPESAAAALERMVARLGPGLRARARAHAERSFDWTATFDRLIELYHEVAAGRAA